MHSLGLLQRRLTRNCPVTHLACLKALSHLVSGLLARGSPTLTDRGCAMPGCLLTKSKIKCVDRALGNRALHRERCTLYTAMARCLLGGARRPVILGDWSECDRAGHRWLVLKAALALGGRAFTLYEEVHPLARYSSAQVHRRFLRRLAEVVWPGCRPIVVSDAGFRAPWFREVERLGWDWIRRIRNRIGYSFDEGKSWGQAKDLYTRGGAMTMYLGRAHLSKRVPYAAQLHLLRRPKRGPGHPRKAHGKGAAAIRERQRYREPWLLATLLPHRRGAERCIANRLVKKPMHGARALGSVEL